MARRGGGAVCRSLIKSSALPVRPAYPPRKSPQIQCRYLQDTPRAQSRSLPSFAFAFDIDGVLLRGSKPIHRARKALTFLHKNRIPFILLTNGGGKLESERVADIRRFLGLREGVLREECFIQSHTPFADLRHGDGTRPSLSDKTIMVVGGDGDQCRNVAQSYGYQSVVTPSDLYHAHPAIWPFSSHFSDYHARYARALPLPVYIGNPTPPNIESILEAYLRIHAIFVFNDPRDWGLDLTVLIDLLLSHGGCLGTLSEYNGNAGRQNRGYQQQGQPRVWYSNPDLWWAAEWPLPRIGQGGFRAAVDGVWKTTTGVDLSKEVCGKPSQATYQYAERVLVKEREFYFGKGAGAPRRVYMIGDNPASDIAGAVSYRSPFSSRWEGILVRTGVYQSGKPQWEPKIVVEDVWDAVEWAARKEGWDVGQIEDADLD